MSPAQLSLQVFQISSVWWLLFTYYWVYIVNFGTTTVTLQSAQGRLVASTYIFASYIADGDSVYIYAENSVLNSSGFAIQGKNN